MKYSFNGEDWTDWAPNVRITLANVGDYVYVKGNNPDGFSYDDTYGDAGGKGYTFFSMTGSIAASGSVMSLVDETGESSVIPNPYCFSELFYGCTALTSAPKVPATELKHSCYALMFHGCKNLTKAPELPATTMKTHCYASMFYQCEKLEKAPELPALTLAQACYASMFYKCTSLKKAPGLPAVALMNKCYLNMFADCESLIEAPELPATNLVSSCYDQMFNGCINLKYIKVGVMSLDNSINATSDWVEGVDGEGVIIFPCGSRYNKHGISEAPTNFSIVGSPIIIFQNSDGKIWKTDTIKCDEKPDDGDIDPYLDDDHPFLGWDKQIEPISEPGVYYYTAIYGGTTSPIYTDYLCFTAEEDGSQFWYENVRDNSPDIEYSLDETKWYKLNEKEVVTLEDAGDKVYLRGFNEAGFSFGTHDYTYFEMTGRIAASGSVMSLIDGAGMTNVIPSDSCFYSLFEYCESLTQAPKLPALSLTKGCYMQMFQECVNLTKAPELPATTLAPNCYEDLFYGCSSLLESPELPSNIMESRCYFRMFQNCTSLKTAPILSSVTLAESCYSNMFYGCKSLVVAPNLPAKILKEKCYYAMFGQCESLNYAPALPAEKLEPYCYAYMFTKCTSLEKAPMLPATEWADFCYWYMFDGCTSLNYMEVAVNSLDIVPRATERWVSNVDGPGLFVFPCGSKYDKHGVSEVPINFEIKSSPIIVFQNPDNTELWRDTIGCDVKAEYKGVEPPYWKEGFVFKKWDKELTIHEEPGVYYYTAEYESTDPSKGDWLCFTAEDVDCYFFYRNQGDNNPNVQYSTDEGETWQDLEANVTVTFRNVGDRIYVRGNNPNGFSQGDNVYTYIGLGGSVSASGTVMSLIDGTGRTTEIPNKSCFHGLFMHCSALTRAPKLTALTLKDNCYENMFANCMGLTSTPELPATNLATECYNGMFMNCRNIVSTVKVLPATQLADACYANMYFNCSSLISAPALPALDLTETCYGSMFYGCSSLVEAPTLASTNLADGCYGAMFGQCESLEEAPALPAMNLSPSCYYGMFWGCTNLRVAPELPATVLKPSCYAEMFLGCKSLSVAPELPATELVSECYLMMFYACENLFRIKVGVMSLDNDLDATNNWVAYIDGPGLFEFPCGSKYDKHGESEVPTNFDIKASPIIIFQNPDGTELWRDTIGCDVKAEYRGVQPPYWKDGYEFKKWDKELTVHEIPDVYYYVAIYESTSSSQKGNWLCFTAEEAGAYVSYENMFENKPDMQYSIDGGENWFKWEPDAQITLANVGDKVYVRGNNPTGFSHGSLQLTRFVTKGKLAASGSVMSLIDETGETQVIPNDYCFYQLFERTSITTAPELPALSLKGYCYYFMFNYCLDLITAPELPATRLAESCYFGMFEYCKNLTTIPDILPATNLEEDCYAHMFQVYESLTYAPELPATTLKDECYLSMFLGCKSLTKAPELPAVNLAKRCYLAMFGECSSLEKAPELPATNLTYECYSDMFYKCSSLNYIKVGVLTLDNDVYATSNWVSDIYNQGTFIFPCGSKYDKHGDSEVPYDFKIISSPIVIFQNPDSVELYRDTIPCDVVPVYRGVDPPYWKDGYEFTGWDKELTVHPEPDTFYYTATYRELGPLNLDNILCFTAEESNSTVQYFDLGNYGPNVEFSTDSGKTWNALESGVEVLLENKGDKAYFRGNNPNGFSLSYEEYTEFDFRGRISASGSVMSLIDQKGETTEIPNDYCFNRLFIGQTSLVQAPELPATKLTGHCYEDMFFNCSNLINGPKIIPATKMEEASCNGMFEKCSSLREAPELPATTLAHSCYFRMFYGCVSMERAPSLPALKMTPLCYKEMFYGCKFEEAPVLPATLLALDCYAGMFSNSMIESIELPATKLEEECYREMFQNCERLNYIKVGVMTLDNDFNATSDWVDGVEENGVFVFPCGSKYDKHGVSEVPDNFVIVASPIVVFQNPDGEELYRDTIGCDVVAEYIGETPTMGDGSIFKGWDKELTIHEVPDTYYYTAEYEETQPVSGNWLCFTAEKTNSIISYRNAGGNSPDVQYSADEGKTWQTWAENEALILKNVGDKIYVRGNNPDGFSHMANLQKSDGEETGQYTNFKMSGEIAASGSVMSLIDGKGESLVIPCDFCFAHLFDGQRNSQMQEDIMTTALTKAPELPATTLTKGCYLDMFGTCSLLKEAPVLPATELASACYLSMFNNCNSLEVAPALPSTKLSEHCYEGMFANSGVSVAPELPATELADSCYWGMFLFCKNLESAPELLATELKPGCYYRMFVGCSNLNYIKVGVMTLDNDFDATKDWVAGVNGPGTFIFPCGSKYDKHGSSEVPENFKIISSPVVVFQNLNGEELYRDTIACDVVAEYKGETPTYGEGLVFKGWDKELTVHPEPDTFYYTAVYEEEQAPITDVSKCLCFTAEEAESEVIVGIGSLKPDVQYSVDEGKTWQILSGNEMVLLSNVGDKVYFRGFNPNGFSGVDGIPSHFIMKGSIAASGSVMSLIDGVGESTVIPNDECFSLLFAGCSSLTRAPELTATVLSKNCYSAMFSDCVNLTQAPKLPATTMMEGCYSEMFLRCTGLTQAPELPSTTLAEYCYWCMFNGCANLVVAPKLPATVLKENCYGSMFMSCTSLTQAPELPAKTMAKNCYRSMFVSCTSLTKAPDLPATELAEGCYMRMFAACDNLNYIKVGVMTLDNDFDATKEWFLRVNGPGTFIFPCGSKYDKHGESEVPMNFKIISSPIVIFQNPDGEELYRDTIGCDVVPEYRGETPNKEGYYFRGWDKELTIHELPDVYYYTAVYEEKENELLHLTVDDELYLVLPGGSENIGYELLEGGGSRYEIWYNGVKISDGVVTNDSIVLLNCPAELSPGSYEATLVMYDENDGHASSDFEFNVMLPDDKENSYYVKAWNDVVICRNGDGIFQSYMWYKDRKKQENSSYQYYNDKTLLNGEYMVYVCDVYGKCYFIEPTSFQIEEAEYAVSAYPNVVDRGTDFIITVSGVDESHLNDARIVIYRSDGVVARIIDEVEMENEMHLGLGEYVIVLTVSDGKNANCKVLIK
ncbi:MAG: leucine-rich repeat protein [Paludibacteraceae bacterium]|nr:leucine-rich repeat protein [Paludibacteraceae bacterium]